MSNSARKEKRNLYGMLYTKRIFLHANPHLYHLYVNGGCFKKKPAYLSFNANSDYILFTEPILCTS